MSSNASTASVKAPPINSETADGVVLTPKNVQALRTLFNIAHRLHHLLGPAWVLILDILNTLDRILMSPRTTTQVGPKGWQQSGVWLPNADPVDCPLVFDWASTELASSISQSAPRHDVVAPRPKTQWRLLNASRVPASIPAVISMMSLAFHGACSCSALRQSLDDIIRPEEPLLPSCCAGSVDVHSGWGQGQ